MVDDADVADGGPTQAFVRSLFKPAPAPQPHGPKAGGKQGGVRSRSPSPEPGAAELERLRQLDEELSKAQQVRGGRVYVLGAVQGTAGAGV